MLEVSHGIVILLIFLGLYPNVVMSGMTWVRVADGTMTYEGLLILYLPQSLDGNGRG